MTDDELQTLLDTLIEKWENEVVEFKQAATQFDSNKTGEYVSALSNEANLRNLRSAWLVFGISNERVIVGTQHLQTTNRQHSLKQTIQQGIDQNLTVREIYEVIYKGHRVVLLEVPAAPRGIPISWKGDFKARAGESLTALPLDKLDDIRNQTLATDWTAVVVPEATLNHLDPLALARAREGFTDRHRSRVPASEIALWDDPTFLDKARLTVDGGITRTALLLLGKRTAAHLLAPHLTQLTWRLTGQEEAYEHFYLPFMLTASELASRIRNIRIRLLPPDELIYREIAKYDERSILEAIYNAIAHQDYLQHARVIVTEYPDRLDFHSVGNFFDGTPDDYRLGDRTPSRYRNPFLVAAMHELHLIDQMGYGIHRMVQDQVNRFLPLPDYDLTKNGEVRLTIPGAVIDEAYSRLLMVRTDLPIEDIAALDRVQKGLDISREAIAHLRKAKLIEGRKPNFRVSESIANATGRLIDYVRARPQSDAHYAKLVADLLERQGGGSRESIDALLMPLLPEILNDDQKRTKVSNLLTKMRRDGSIRNTGSRSQPWWEPALSAEAVGEGADSES